MNVPTQPDLPKIRPVRPKKRAEPFDDPEWIFELKYDGFRAFAYFDGNKCKLVSKQDKRLQFPDLEEELQEWFKKQRIQNVIFDGELVSLDHENRPDLKRLLRHEGEIVYLAFDILWLDGRDLRSLPLIARKKILERFAKVKSTGCIRGVLWQREIGIVYYKLAIKHKLEGIVAKRAAGPYSRNTCWFKIKNPKYVQSHRMVWRR